VDTEAPQGGVDDAASAEELPDEPAPEVAAAAGDAHHRVRHEAAHIPLVSSSLLLKPRLDLALCVYAQVPAVCKLGRIYTKQRSRVESRREQVCTSRPGRSLS